MGDRGKVSEEIVETTPLRVKVTCNMPGHKRPCSNDVMEAALIDAHLQVVAFCHGKISGMDSGIRVRYRLSRVEAA